jgi:indolepyruvate ferredoxin oxidoreductase beta subunit
MAQRGGSVTSHVRIGHDIDSPIISPGGADIILAFELCEATRAVPYLKPGGVMVLCDRAIQPASLSGPYDTQAVREYLNSAVKRLYILNSGHIISKCGARCLNVAILGAALSSGALPFNMDDMEKTIEARFSGNYAEMNKNALRLGAELAKTSIFEKAE